MFPEQRQNLVFLRSNIGASSQVFQIAHRVSHPPLISFNRRQRLVMPAGTTAASVLIPARRPLASKSRLASVAFAKPSLDGRAMPCVKRPGLSSSACAFRYARVRALSIVASTVLFVLFSRMNDAVAPSPAPTHLADRPRSSRACRLRRPRNDVDPYRCWWLAYQLRWTAVPGRAHHPRSPRSYLHNGSFHPKL
jgi:hypothetical protein